MNKDKTIIIRVSEAELEFLKENMPFYKDISIYYSYGSAKPNLTEYIRYCIVKDLLSRGILSENDSAEKLNDFVYSGKFYSERNLKKINNSLKRENNNT